MFVRQDEGGGHALGARCVSAAAGCGRSCCPSGVQELGTLGMPSNKLPWSERKSAPPQGRDEVAEDMEGMTTEGGSTYGED